MVRGGPWVPVRIYVEREIDPATGELLNPEILCKEIAGRPGGDPAYRFGELKAISREEYDSLMEAHAFSPVMQATHVAKPDLTITPARP